MTLRVLLGRNLFSRALYTDLTQQSIPNHVFGEIYIGKVYDIYPGGERIERNKTTKARYTIIPAPLGIELDSVNVVISCYIRLFRRVRNEGNSAAV